MKILVLADGSPCSVRAAEKLLELLPQWKEVPQVDVLHVVAPIPIGLVQSHLSASVLTEHYREVGQEALAPVMAVLRQGGLKAEEHLHAGEVKVVLPHQLETLAPDLILMGTHGRGGVQSLVLGSMAQRVLQLSSVPVLLVK